MSSPMGRQVLTHIKSGVMDTEMVGLHRVRALHKYTHPHSPLLSLESESFSLHFHKSSRAQCLCQGEPRSSSSFTLENFCQSFCLSDLSIILYIMGVTEDLGDTQDTGYRSPS